MLQIEKLKNCGLIWLDLLVMLHFKYKSTVSIEKCSTKDT